MSKQHNVHRKSVVLVAAIAAMASVVALAIPATAKPAPPPSGPKLYSVELDAVGAGSGAVQFTLTFTNLPSSSSVIGSINVTVPSGFTGIGSPAISSISPGRNWNASKTGNLIKLRAGSDKQKLTPGQFVAVTFTATPPTGSGSFVFETGAKASRDFSGSPTFSQVGFNPVVVRCPTTGPCTATLGNTANAPPGQQTGEITLDGDCDCLLIITSTPGNFCSAGEGETHDACRSQLVVRFNIIGFYDSTASLTVTCDVNDCPEIVPPPCEIECSFVTSSEADFYPVFYTDSDSNTASTNVVQVDNFCESEGPRPCLISSGRLSEGSNDYQSVLDLEFFGSVDPRVGH